MASPLRETFVLRVPSFSDLRLDAGSLQAGEKVAWHDEEGCIGGRNYGDMDGLCTQIRGFTCLRFHGGAVLDVGCCKQRMFLFEMYVALAAEHLFLLRIWSVPKIWNNLFFCNEAPQNASL